MPQGRVRIVSSRDLFMPLLKGSPLRPLRQESVFVRLRILNSNFVLLISRDWPLLINNELPLRLHFLAVHRGRENYGVHLRNQFLRECVSH